MALARKPAKKVLVIIRTDRQFLVDKVVHIFTIGHLFSSIHRLGRVSFSPDFAQKKCPFQEHTF
jgi:hypothetical protein